MDQRMSLNSKKILIAYASAGEGHRRSAEAIYNYIEANFKVKEVKIFDVLDYTNFIFKNLYSKGYKLLVSKLPFLWNLAYQLTYNPTLKGFIKNLRYITNRINTKNFKKFLIKYNPEFVITTHFLVAEIISNLKKNSGLKTHLVAVITDFSIHPFWISDGVDDYMVACEHSRDELIAFGVEKDKIRVTGIPVDLKFSKIYNRTSFAERLGIDCNRFTILLVMAGFGLGPIERIVESLYKDIQLLVVCGKNRNLYKRLINKGYPSVMVFGFINNIEELMAVSDIIVTKPGGLTTSESLIMNLPMLFFSHIYGQEIKNAKILEGYGVGISFFNPRSLKEAIIDYKNNSDKLFRIKENISKMRKPYAAKEICDALFKS